MRNVTNLILCGDKAHASFVYRALSKIKRIQIQAVFSDNDIFCMLDQQLVGEIARAKNIPTYKPKELTVDTLKSISEKSPVDLMLLVEWKQLLDSSIFSFPKLGTFNIHDSLLPEYRGSSPMNWTIINGLTLSGATFYSLNEKADSGPIWAQKSFQIKPDDYAIDVLKKTCNAYETVAIEGVNAVLDKKNPAQQNEEKATYCAKRLPSDGFLDFNLDVNRIYNTIRALTPPFPGAFCFYEGKKVIILKASIAKKQPFYVGNIPGKLLNTRKILVLCGKGVLHIEKIHVKSNGKVYNDPETFFVDKNFRINQND
ncbi:MAG: hypothetical protein CL402_00625 [Acidiferrobacteraceae bacterium]|nr:hypothetical protein [Acidiferrobacteraceae bacterium]|tara:strand:+ start:1397 stop:2335 length:939 start_codon:yes stop_codon:yes gene_type:complete